MIDRYNIYEGYEEDGGGWEKEYDSNGEFSLYEDVEKLEEQNKELIELIIFFYEHTDPVGFIEFKVRETIERHTGKSYENNYLDIKAKYLGRVIEDYPKKDDEIKSLVEDLESILIKHRKMMIANEDGSFKFIPRIPKQEKEMNKPIFENEEECRDIFNSIVSMTCYSKSIVKEFVEVAKQEGYIYKRQME